VVVVVVPALAEGGDGEWPEVAAGVGGGVAPPPDHVGQRVDRERGVPQQDGRPEEAHDDAGPAGDEERGDAEAPRPDPVVAVEEPQFGEASEVPDLVVVAAAVVA
jgi:hypothetical protein